MKITEEFKEWFHSIESDSQKKLHLLAFRDFCADLFEEEYGRMSPEEEIVPRFAQITHSGGPKFLPKNFL